MNINKIILTPVIASLILALILGYLMVCIIIVGLLMASVTLTFGSDSLITQIIAPIVFSCIIVYGLFWLITDIQKKMKK